MCMCVYAFEGRLSPNVPETGSSFPIEIPKNLVPDPPLFCPEARENAA